MKVLRTLPNADWTINQVVENFPDALPVLGRHGIDTCCGGQKTIRDVATAHGIPIEQLLVELDQVVNPTDVVLDVRPDLRAGQDPLSKIIAAAESLRDEQSLVILVGFEPTPLYGVLAARGFGHRSERTADGAWMITFRRNSAPGR